jgi:hypothetical protein
METRRYSTHHTIMAFHFFRFARSGFPIGLSGPICLGALIATVLLTGCLQDDRLSAAQLRQVEDTALRVTAVARDGIRPGEIERDDLDHDGVLEPVGEVRRSLFGPSTIGRVTRARCTVGGRVYFLAGADPVGDLVVDDRVASAMRSGTEEALVALNGRSAVGIARSGTTVIFAEKASMTLPVRCRGLFPEGYFVVRRKVN